MRLLVSMVAALMLLTAPVYAAGPASFDPNTVVTAANSGGALAQYELGLMLLSGKGVRQDAHKAGAWFQRAAVQGVSDAQFELAKLQVQGVAPGGKTAAYKWLLICAGTDKARIALRDQVEAELDPELVSVIKKQALTWKPTPEHSSATH